MASSPNSSSSDCLLPIALKQKNMVHLPLFLKHTNTHNPDMLFVIKDMEGLNMDPNHLTKCEFHPRLISRSGKTVYKTKFIEGNYKVFQELIEEGKTVHYFQFVQKISCLRWLESSVGANVGLLNEYVTSCHVDDYQIILNRPVTIIYGAHGRGKTTCLNYVKKKLIEQKKLVLFLDNIKLREYFNSFPSSNVANFMVFFAVDLTSPDVHIMYDNFECLKERDDIIDIMVDVHLNYRNVKQWITCSDISCKHKMESKLGTLACFLTPFLKEKQVRYIKKFWNLDHDDLDDFIESIIKQCNKWNWSFIWRGKNSVYCNEFCSFPLHLKMVATAFTPTYSKLRNMSILDVYEGYVKSVYTDNNIEETAVHQLFQYINHEFKFKTNVNLMPEPIEFVNVTNYLAAKWFSKNYSEYREELKLLFYSRRSTQSFIYFLSSFLCQGKRLHIAVLNHWSLRNLCSNVTAHERDAGGRTALHLTESVEDLYTLFKKQVEIDVKDDVLQWAPIQYFEHHGNLTGLEVLLERGADPRLLTWTLTMDKEELSSEINYAILRKMKHYLKYVCENVKEYQVFSKSIWELFSGIPLNVIIMVLNQAKSSTYHYVDIGNRTALFPAVEQNYFDAVKILVNKLKYNIHHRCSGSKTIFHIACEKGFLDIAKYLLDCGVDVNVTLGDDISTALTHCCINNDLPVLRFLIDNDIDINRIQRTGETPMELACSHNSIDVVRYLLQNVINLGINHDIEELLYKAVKKASNDLVELILSQNQEINVNKLFEDGRTLLHVACRGRGDYDAIILRLIQAGADVNATNSKGCTPIFDLLNDLKIDTIKLLADNGCNLSYVNNNGETPLHVYARKCVDTYVVLRMQLWEEYYSFASLVTYGANVTARTPSGDTPLHCACRNTNIAVIKVLVSQGSDIHAVNNEGETPLHLVSGKESGQFNGKMKAVPYLVSKGADVNARTNSNKTPIMYAVTCTPNIKILIDLGADLYCKDSDNKTLTHYFTENNLLKQLKLLANEGMNDAKSVDSAGQTALHIAAKNNNWTCIEILKKYFQTDDSIADNNGQSVMDFM